MSAPKTIYLQPECCVDIHVGRLWCEHGSPEECEDGEPWTEYRLVGECEWMRQFDGHFNISCVNETKERANGDFHSSNVYKSRWSFKFCPYCGNRITIKEAE